MYPEKLQFETEKGDMVRSKSEVIIANILYNNSDFLLYKYERPLKLMMNGKEILMHPDFTIIHKRTGRIKYWEHVGRIDDPIYANDFVKRFNVYIMNDLLPGRDIVFTSETMNRPLDIKVVKKIIQSLIEQ